MSPEKKVERLEAEVQALRQDVLGLVKICRSLNQMDMQGVLLLMLRTGAGRDRYKEEFGKFSAEQQIIRKQLLEIERRAVLQDD